MAKLIATAIFEIILFGMLLAAAYGVRHTLMEAGGLREWFADRWNGGWPFNTILEARAFMVAQGLLAVLWLGALVTTMIVGPRMIGS